MSKDKIEALDAIYPQKVDEDSHKCIKCGRTLHEQDEDYLTFQGNVYVGEQGGIIGNNIPVLAGSDKDADKFRAEDIHKTRICLACFMKDMYELRDKTVDNLKAKAERYIRQIEGLNDQKPLDIPSFLKGGN